MSEKFRAAAAAAKQGYVGANQSDEQKYRYVPVPTELLFELIQQQQQAFQMRHQVHGTSAVLSPQFVTFVKFANYSYVQVCTILVSLTVDICKFRQYVLVILVPSPYADSLLTRLL